MKLIEGEEERGGSDSTTRSKLEKGLPVDELFSHFTIRWIEMQYDRYTKQVVPGMLSHTKWEPLAANEPTARYDQTAKGECYECYEMIVLTTIKYLHYQTYIYSTSRGLSFYFDKI